MTSNNLLPATVLKRKAVVYEKGLHEAILTEEAI